jgi:YD repeat-containing protein
VFSKPRSITRSGNGKSLTRSYVYDAAQRLCKTIEPETKATVQDYDDAGNVAWRAPGLSLLSTTDCSTASVPAARKISYQYDPLNRLGQTTFGDGSPLIKRDYTPDGLPYTITSNGATWTNSYNKRRLNEQESLVYGGVTYTFDRRYDANGSLLKVKYPQDSTWLDYNPNALGEPRQVGAYATGIAYHPNGAIAAFRYGNGIVHSLSPNRRGLPEWSQDVGILKDNYGYDENGNVTSIADWQEGITNDQPRCQCLEQRGQRLQLEPPVRRQRQRQAARRPDLRVRPGQPAGERTGQGHVRLRRPGASGQRGGHRWREPDPGVQPGRQAPVHQAEQRGERHKVHLLAQPRNRRGDGWRGAIRPYRRAGQSGSPDGCGGQADQPDAL